MKGVIDISHGYTNYDSMVSDVSKATNLTIDKTKSVIDSYLQMVEQQITNGKRVTIPYIGSFQPKIMCSRKYRNISTGEMQTSLKHYGVKFSPKTKLIKTMNERNDIFQ